MLARYHMRRGASADELPQGVRQDTRKHTRHALRPIAEDVRAYLAGTLPWPRFADRYLAAIQARASDDPTPFDRLAELAQREDVFIGCSCPSRANPDVRRCHTWLALQWMSAEYPDLEVRFPDP